MISRGIRREMYSSSRVSRGAVRLAPPQVSVVGRCRFLGGARSRLLRSPSVWGELNGPDAESGLSKGCCRKKKPDTIYTRGSHQNSCGVPLASWVYILPLRSDSLYVGACHDLKHRFSEHLSGRASRLTALDPPISIAYSEELQVSLRPADARPSSNAGPVPRRKR